METTSPKYFCFVLMPFTSDFDDIYALGIKDSCKELDVYCERVDEQIFKETILERIYNQISKADLIIADMTGRNPNVFYEVGYAHALNKPTILLTQNADDIPFDLKHFPHIIYNNKITLLKEQLSKKVIWFKENIRGDKKIIKQGIDVFVDDQNLASGDIVHEYPNTQLPNFSIVIHNTSARTYEPGDFQIGIICKEYSKTKDSRITSTKLPDGNYLHMLPFFDLLFPEVFNSYYICFTGIFNHLNNFPENVAVIIKVFSDEGNREYNLTIVKKTPENLNK